MINVSLFSLGLFPVRIVIVYVAIGPRSRLLSFVDQFYPWLLRYREQTLYWIERCLDAHLPNFIKIASDKNFDFVRDDPRFRAALIRLHFPS